MLNKIIIKRFLHVSLINKGQQKQNSRFKLSLFENIVKTDFFILNQEFKRHPHKEYKSLVQSNNIKKSSVVLDIGNLSRQLKKLIKSIFFFKQQIKQIHKSYKLYRRENWLDRWWTEQFSRLTLKEKRKERKDRGKKLKKIQKLKKITIKFKERKLKLKKEFFFIFLTDNRIDQTIIQNFFERKEQKTRLPLKIIVPKNYSLLHYSPYFQSRRIFSTLPFNKFLFAFNILNQNAFRSGAILDKLFLGHEIDTKKYAFSYNTENKIDSYKKIFFLIILIKRILQRKRTSHLRSKQISFSPKGVFNRLKSLKKEKKEIK